ncbi:MAG: hypothetical protein ACWA5A_04370 [Marinibacterium sp.]
MSCRRPNPLPISACLILAIVPAGCIQVPDLDRVGDQATLAAAQYPPLVPLGPILAAAPPPLDAPDANTPADDLTARAAALQARAARLAARPVLTPADRARLTGGTGS